MKRTLLFGICAVIALGAATHAQDPQDKKAKKARALAEAQSAAKVSLSEAIQRAERTFSAKAVDASLDVNTPKAEPGKVVAVYKLTLHKDGRLFKAEVDPVTGEATLAKPKAAAPKAAAVTSGSGFKDGFEKAAQDGGVVGWKACETHANGAPASWKVVTSEHAPEGTHFVSVSTKNLDQVFNILLADAPAAADLDISVKLRADSGKDDQGGGVVWRAIDADNYYIARWNPLESNLRAYKIVKGVRTMFVSAKTTADAAGWHELRIRMQGTKGTVVFDTTTTIDFEDATFPAAGKVGLWTKADASTSFDDFRAGPPKSP